MSTIFQSRNRGFCRIATAAGFVLSTVLFGAASPVAAESETKPAEEAAGTTFDNLVPVKDSSVATAYIDPEADFSVFKRVFTERLEAAGYEVVDGANEDVLLLRPAVIDLDITAPDTRSAGRSRTFTASTGAATLYMQLFDSLSGDIIGRAADRQSVRRGGGSVSWSNSVTNTADARRMFGRWADTLVGFLDKHYK